MFMTAPGFRIGGDRGGLVPWDDLKLVALVPLEIGGGGG